MTDTPALSPEEEAAKLKVADVALTKAKLQLMRKPESAFFATICFNLKTVWDFKIPTAATDGQRILVNPDFFLGLNPSEQLFIVLHETLHCALLHTVRLNERNPRKWNYAADYVINHMLITRQFTMPKGGLHDAQYADLSTEEVYELIDDPPEDFVSDLLEGELDADEAKAAMDEILVQASLQSQMLNEKPGAIPGELDRYIKGLTESKMPWHHILRKFMNAMKKNLYSFKKPNRRFFPDHFMPSQYSEGLNEIAIVVDVSGSITEEQFQHFVSETYNIIRKLKPSKTTFQQFDWGIRDISELKTVNDLKNLRFQGGGGTCLEETFKWIDEERPTVVIIFTDGWVSLPPKPANTKVIWIIDSNPTFSCDYGKIIHYELP